MTDGGSGPRLGAARAPVVGLADLVASLRPALRFLVSADGARAARAGLPVSAWRGRIAGLLGAGDARLRSRLTALDDVLVSLETGDRRAAAERALHLLDEIDPLESAARAAVAPEPAAETPSPGAAPTPYGSRPAMTVGELERALERMASPLSSLRGVGPARAEELARFGLRTVEDLLYHLPFRYEDRRDRRRVSDLRLGESASVVVVLERVEEGFTGRTRRRVLTAVAHDDSGQLELAWFHGMRFFRGRLKTGTRWRVHGKVDRGFVAPWRMVHPEMEPWQDAAAEACDDAPAGDGRPTNVLPVYEKPTAMHVAVIRRLARANADQNAAHAPHVLPQDLRRGLGLLDLPDALRLVHDPPPSADLAVFASGRSPAHRAIVFDELVFLQMGLLLRKASVVAEPGIAFAGPGDLTKRMLDGLPFRLTGAQQRVIDEITRDMRIARPMHRLVQGDVGSGKTVIAVAAALRAIECGHQAAIMAPTELLAEQHWRTVQRVADGLGVPLWLLTGEARAADRRAVLPRLAAGEPGLVVGTHALIQEEVAMARLGLAVIDEQHRFGVLQRAALGRHESGAAPDVLLMTATPIPRTLALSVYGDLDLSYVDELPPGRKPIETRLYGSHQRSRAFELVRAELAAGRQAYVVFPLVEESEKSDLRDATSAAAELAAGPLEGFRVGLVHGRMAAAERDAVMREFQAGSVHALVSTTVIEVGIDVPNASVIVIDHAERFGLAQLHQLRGRVGRGADAAYCILLADWAQSKEARERLQVMTRETNGLRIAEADLAIRGPGAILGTRQSGLPDFRVANLLRDVEVLGEARRAAAAILADDPQLERPENAAISRLLHQRWAGRLGLARVG